MTLMAIDTMRGAKRERPALQLPALRGALGVCADLGFALSLLLVLAGLGTVGVALGAGIGVTSLALLLWNIIARSGGNRQVADSVAARSQRCSAERNRTAA